MSRSLVIKIQTSKTTSNERDKVTSFPGFGCSQAPSDYPPTSLLSSLSTRPRRRATRAAHCKKSSHPLQRLLWTNKCRKGVAFLMGGKNLEGARGWGKRRRLYVTDIRRLPVQLSNHVLYSYKPHRKTHPGRATHRYWFWMPQTSPLWPEPTHLPPTLTEEASPLRVFPAQRGLLTSTLL